MITAMLPDICGNLTIIITRSKIFYFTPVITNIIVIVSDAVGMTSHVHRHLLAIDSLMLACASVSTLTTLHRAITQVRIFLYWPSSSYCPRLRSFIFMFRLLYLYFIFDFVLQVHSQDCGYC